MFGIYNDETPAGRGVFEECYPSKEEALRAAESEWNGKSESEKASCGEFYVGFFELDEDGLCAHCIEVVKRFK